jgi:hypothetical protein
MTKDASGCIDDIVANLTDWRGPGLARIRKIIRDADPGVVEECKWMGSPVWSCDGNICVATVCKDKLKLTFAQGAKLADPDKLFNNGLDGKQWRSIDIYEDSHVNESSLKNLVRAAIDYNRSGTKAVVKPRVTRYNPKKKSPK